MGYSIYYDRAFIRVGDKYIPLVSSGASNSGPRSERDWDVLNWKRRDRVLFSAAEIQEIAKDYEQNHQLNGMSFKSRNIPFAPGEFEQWVVDGMSHAYSIGEYLSFGNHLYVVDYPDGVEIRWRKQPFTTDKELLGIIEQLGTGHEFHVSFGDSRVVHRPTNRGAQKDRRDAGQNMGKESSVPPMFTETQDALPDRPFAYVCSPLRGDMEANMARAREYSRQVFDAGYCPITPHIYFPQFLNDTDPQERKAGMAMGAALLSRCSLLVVCGNSISEGMAQEIEEARHLNIPAFPLDSILPGIMCERQPNDKPSVREQLAAARAESTAAPKRDVTDKSKSCGEER